MTMPKVSVIIPVYNGQEYIAATLETVFAQTFRDFEVIVVDDGSTDRTEAILERFGDKISLLKNSHRGPASSRNLGLEVSRGSLIAFLDSDDLWLPKKLERQVSIAGSHPEYGIITSDMAKFDASGIVQPSCAVLRPPISSGYVLEELLFDNWIGTSCAMVRRECFEKAGKFADDSIALGKDDWNMWMRIAAHYPIYYLDEVLVHYRVHPQSFSDQPPEKLLAGWLTQLDWLEESIPQLRAQHELMQEARFCFCWRTGWDILRALDPEVARDSLRCALRYSPYSAKAWIALAITHLPMPVLRLLRSTARTARWTLSSHGNATPE
jgi:glycosyltransferase involved in cell wall biosynthesis